MGRLTPLATLLEVEHDYILDLQRVIFNTDIPTLDELVNTTQQKHDKALAYSYSQSRERFVDWILNTSTTHKHLYKWIKKPLNQGLLPDVDLKAHATTPLEMAQHRSQTWRKWWQRDNDLDHELHQLPVATDKSEAARYRGTPNNQIVKISIVLCSCKRRNLRRELAP